MMAWSFTPSARTARTMAASSTKIRANRTPTWASVSGMCRNAVNRPNRLGRSQESQEMSKIEVTDRPAANLPRPKWMKWLFIGGLIVAGLALAAVNFILSSMDKELQEAIADTDRLDPGWRMPELELKRPVIPDEENSTLVIMAARNLLPANWPY